MIIHELRFPVHHAGPMVIHEPVHAPLVAVAIATTPFSLEVRPMLDDGNGNDSQYNTQIM